VLSIVVVLCSCTDDCVRISGFAFHGEWIPNPNTQNITCQGHTNEDDVGLLRMTSRGLLAGAVFVLEDLVELNAILRFDGLPT